MRFPYLVYFPFRSFHEKELERRASAVIPQGSERKHGKSESRRLAYFAGRVAIAVALERVGLTGLKVAPDPDYGYLQVVGREREIFVNVSHSGEFAVAGVSSFPIGVDVERGDRPVARALERVAADSELKQLATQGQVSVDGGKIPAAIALWCGKEACSKAVGLGIKFGMQAFAISFGDSQPTPVKISLKGPLQLANPAVRYAWVAGHVIAVCTARELLGDLWGSEMLT